ncbi:Transcriptional regulatory protein sin3 [Elasticomyces elasticus]|nr:Transcriptional regulatory protein sin3 [Elasticomyces elasticus]
MGKNKRKPTKLKPKPLILEPAIEKHVKDLQALIARSPDPRGTAESLAQQLEAELKKKKDLLATPPLPPAIMPTQHLLCASVEDEAEPLPLDPAPATAPVLAVAPPSPNFTPEMAEELDRVLDEITNEPAPAPVVGGGQQSLVPTRWTFRFRPKVRAPAPARTPKAEMKEDVVDKGLDGIEHPIVAVDDFVGHKDVKARAVYWMNRALISDPSRRITIGDVYAQYGMSFNGHGVEILGAMELTDLIAKMFKGASMNSSAIDALRFKTPAEIAGVEEGGAKGKSATETVAKQQEALQLKAQISAADAMKYLSQDTKNWVDESTGNTAQDFLRDAHLYSNQVKETFPEGTKEHAQFIQILLDLQRGEPPPSIHKRISTLFAARPELIKGFEIYRPELWGSGRVDAAARALMSGVSEKKSHDVEDGKAKDFLDQVKDVYLADQPDVYYGFMEIMHEYTSSPESTPQGIREKVRKLLHGRSDLFETFLGYLRPDSTSEKAEPAADASMRLSAGDEAEVDEFDEHLPMDIVYGPALLARGRKLWYIKEPSRTRLWARMLFEPGNNEEVCYNSMVLLYVATFRRYRGTPHEALSVQTFADALCTLFPYAEHTEVAPSRFVFYGISPRAKPLNPKKLLRQFRDREECRRTVRTRRQLEMLEASGDVQLRIGSPINAFQNHLLEDAMLTLPTGTPSPWLQRLRSRRAGEPLGDHQPGFPGVSMRGLSTEMRRGSWVDEEYSLLVAETKMKSKAQPGEDPQRKDSAQAASSADRELHGPLTLETPSDRAGGMANAMSDAEAQLMAPIGFRFVHKLGYELQMRTKNDVKLGSVMALFAEQVYKPRELLRFQFNGRSITDDATPDTIGLQDGDVVTVEGGGGTDVDATVVVGVDVPMPSPPEQNINMTLVSQNREIELSFMVNKDDRYTVGCLMDAYARHVSTSRSALTLRFRGNEVREGITPDEAGMRHGDIIEVCSPEPESPLPSSTVLSIKFGNKDDGGEATFSVGGETLLGECMNGYAYKAKKKRENLRFVFKGEEVFDDATANSMGLQEGDRVEVRRL